MRKILILLTLAAVMMFVFTACSGDAAEESNTIGQTMPTTQDGQQHSQAHQEPQSVTSDSATQNQPEQSDTLSRIREHEDWTADILERWENILGVTVDEIFDHVRAQSRRDYTFEYRFEGIDVDEWAAAVGNTPYDFMSIIHRAYSATRSVDVVHRWASELGMTIDEFIEHFESHMTDATPISDAIGIDVEEFIFAMAGAMMYLRPIAFVFD